MDNKRFNELSAGYLEDALTSEELSEFAALLREHPELHTEFQKDIRLQVLMRDVAVEELNLAKEVRERPVSEPEPLHRFRRSGRRFRLIWVSLAACLVIVAGAYFFNLWQMSQTHDLIRAKLIEVHGRITIERDGDEMPAEKDRIETGTGGKAELKYNNEDTAISIFEDTDLHIKGKGGAKQIYLDRGKIHCSVSKQPE